MGKQIKMKTQVQNFLFITLLLLFSFSMQKKMYKEEIESEIQETSENEETSEIEDSSDDYEESPLSITDFKDFGMLFLQRWLPILLKLKPLKGQYIENWIKLIKNYLQKIKENGGDFPDLHNEACINAVLPLAIGKNMGDDYSFFHGLLPKYAPANFKAIHSDLKIICK